MVRGSVLRRAAGGEVARGTARAARAWAPALAPMPDSGGGGGGDGGSAADAAAAAAASAAADWRYRNEGGAHAVFAYAGADAALAGMVLRARKAVGGSAGGGAFALPARSLARARVLAKVVTNASADAHVLSRTRTRRRTRALPLSLAFAPALARWHTRAPRSQTHWRRRSAPRGLDMAATLPARARGHTARVRTPHLSLARGSPLVAFRKAPSPVMLRRSRCPHTSGTRSGARSHRRVGTAWCRQRTQRRARPWAALQVWSSSRTRCSSATTPRRRLSRLRRHGGEAWKARGRQRRQIMARTRPLTQTHARVLCASRSNRSAVCR